jgi:hypothetical protein
MDPASIATAVIGNQAGQAQVVLAEKMMKINADQQSAVAQMVEAAAQQASLPAGVGGNLDIAV